MTSVRAVPETFETMAPFVSQVAGIEERPLWSVMIPTFNCAKYLRRTLESVLAQDPSRDAMQIEVVDDCSTKDDPERVVHEVGQGRVHFYRKPENGGATHNFNTCIERSRGALVHILHGDDFVSPGFYSAIAAAAEAHKDLAAFACRSFVVDEDDVISSVSLRLPTLETAGREQEAFFYTNPLLTPGVVIRRSFYEQHGGFIPALVHTADWEMWSRAFLLGGGVALPQVLANYREFKGNDTSRLVRTAENLRDVERLFAIFRFRYAGFDTARGNLMLAYKAKTQALRFLEAGDREALAANRKFYVTKRGYLIKDFIARKIRRLTTSRE